MTRPKASEKSLKCFSLQIKSWWREFYYHASTIFCNRYSCIHKQKQIFHHNFSRTNTNSTELFDIIQEHTTQSTCKNIIDKGNDYLLSRGSLRYTIWHLFSHFNTLLSFIAISVSNNKYWIFLSNRKKNCSLAITYSLTLVKQDSFASLIWFDLIVSEIETTNLAMSGAFSVQIMEVDDWLSHVLPQPRLQFQISCAWSDIKELRDLFSCASHYRGLFSSNVWKGSATNKQNLKLMRCVHSIICFPSPSKSQIIRLDCNQATTLWIPLNVGEKWERVTKYTRHAKIGVHSPCTTSLFHPLSQINSES